MRKVNHISELKIGYIVRWYKETSPADITDCHLIVTDIDGDRIYYRVVKSCSTDTPYWVKGKVHSEEFKQEYDGVSTYLINKATNFNRKLGMRWSNAK